MFRLNSCQEGLMPLVSRHLAFFCWHVVVAQARQRIGDELMNMVFLLQIKFPSLNLPSQCGIEICQVHVIRLEDEVSPQMS